VSLLARNALANQPLRHVVVRGVELTGTGRAPIRLADRGVDAEHRVLGAGATAVDHDTPEGQLLATHRDRTADELRHRLASFLALTSHARDLNAELQQAETAPRLGVPSAPDAPPAP